MNKLHHTCNRDGRAENVRERKRGKGREDWKGGQERRAGEESTMEKRGKKGGRYMGRCGSDLFLRGRRGRQRAAVGCDY